MDSRAGNSTSDWGLVWRGIDAEGILCGLAGTGVHPGISGNRRVRNIDAVRVFEDWVKPIAMVCRQSEFRESREVTRGLDFKAVGRGYWAESG